MIERTQMTVLKLRTNFKSKLFDCKTPKFLSGEKLLKVCNRCNYKDTAICPLQISSVSDNIFTLTQLPRAAMAASTAATVSTNPLP